MKYLSMFVVKGDGKTLYNCFFPEADKKKRFSLDVKKIKGGIEITACAEDHTALKAITTSVVKLIEVYEKLENVTKTK